MTIQQKERAAYLRGKGDSYTKIAADVGVSLNTVKSFCRRSLGVQSAASGDGCAECGSLLVHTDGAKKKRFCSDKCRMSWWLKHPEAVNRKAVYNFVCPQCGAAFTSYGNTKRKYCSRVCFSAARRAAYG